MKWLDRTLTQCAYYYALCLSESEFFEELERIGLPKFRWSTFLNGNAHATTHHFIHEGQACAIVCLDAELAKEKKPVQVAALLVHEAVHIWQRHASYIGSHNDHGDEEEAYAIQSIAQELMSAYAESLK